MADTAYTYGTGATVFSDGSQRTVSGLTKMKKSVKNAKRKIKNNEI